MKRVLILSSLGRYPAPFDGEVWGLNRSYRLRTPPATRHFVMDGLWARERKGGNEAYATELAALNIPIIMQQHYPEIPLSEPNPTDQIVKDLGIDCPDEKWEDYFTCSIAYMMSRAIWEGAEQIILNKVLSSAAWEEYIGQKACMDFWVGFARGRGIKVHGSSQSIVGKPYPWQPKRYGYEAADQRPVEILTEAVKRIMRKDYAESTATAA